MDICFGLLHHNGDQLKSATWAQVVPCGVKFRDLTPAQIRNVGQIDGAHRPVFIGQQRQAGC